jgi:hypothetical protein
LPAGLQLLLWPAPPALGKGAAAAVAAAAAADPAPPPPLAPGGAPPDPGDAHRCTVQDCSQRRRQGVRPNELAQDGAPRLAVGTERAAAIVPGIGSSRRGVERGVRITDSASASFDIDHHFASTMGI